MMDQNKSCLSSFKSEGVIGSGSFGTVFKVKNILDNQYYAMKRIKIIDNLDICLREIEIMSELKSDFVVNYINYWSDKKIIDRNEETFIYILMELCSQDFGKLIKIINVSFDERFKTIHYFIRSQLLIELIECLNNLHKLSIIHRDLNPSNVMVTDGSNGRFLKLCDFGLAKVYKNSQNSRNQGTQGYIAPEVTKFDTRSTDPLIARYNNKCDIYSLGVIAIKLFDIEDDIEDIKMANIFVSDNYLNTDLEERFRKLLTTISKMLSENPDQRPNCEELLEESSEWTFDQNSVAIIKRDSQLHSIMNTPEILKNIINTKLNQATN